MKTKKCDVLVAGAGVAGVAAAVAASRMGIKTILVEKLLAREVSRQTD